MSLRQPCRLLSEAHTSPDSLRKMADALKRPEGGVVEPDPKLFSFRPRHPDLLLVVFCEELFSDEGAIHPADDDRAYLPWR